MHVVRPDDTEYVPWAKAYVDGVEGTDPSEILARNTGEFLELVARLPGARTYSPGKWTVGEVVGHITDTERILAFRLLCIARGDRTPLPAFEQDEYLRNSGFNERPLAGLVEEFKAVRQSSVLLLKGLPEAAWLRRGTVSGCSVTPRGLAFVLAGHERHHFRILRDKYL